MQLLRTLAKPVLLLACVVALNVGLFKLFNSMQPGLGPMGILVCAFLTGRMLVKACVPLLSEIMFFARGGASEELHGRHYNFEGHRMRFYMEQSVIWMPEADLAGIAPLGLRRGEGLLRMPTRIPGTKLAGLDEETVNRMLLQKLRHADPQREVVRFHAWLNKEALPNVRRLPSSAMIE